ncbi:MAG: hypothetical protein LW832_05360 [Parachlamydia sp.]|nr:hypothetical protein [Parachlamydia sp.]
MNNKINSILQDFIFKFSVVDCKSFLLQLRIIFFGVLIEFLLVGFFLWLNNSDLNWIITPKGFFDISVFFVFFVEITFLFAYTSAIIYWYCAKFRGGKGTLPEICTALLQTGFFTIIPLSLCFFIMSIEKMVGTFICGISCFGLIASLIYGVVRMSIQTSKINGFHSDRGTNVFLFGTLLQSPLLYLAYLVASSRYALMFLIPFTIKITTIILVITIGAKIIKKISSLASI